MNSTRHQLFIASTFAMLDLAACSDGGGSAASTDTGATDEPDVVDPAETSGTVTDDTAAQSPLCETLWSRIQACGHATTFPGFEAWCATDGDVGALEICKVKPCAALVTCLDEAGAPSQGL